MLTSAFARRYFWIAPGGLVAVAAFLNAQAVTQLVGSSLQLDADVLSRAPAVARNAPIASASARTTTGHGILQRNPFDHTTGDLTKSPTPETDDDDAASEPTDVGDPMKAPVCDGVDVKAIVASSDQDWSFASIAGSDGKTHLARRGTEVASKKVHFVGWDRVWFTNNGVLCQSMLFGPAPAPAAAAAPPPAASSSAAPRKGGAPPVSDDVKQGIQAVSATEYNVDRATLDKILENQADLMRQARIVPVMENGKTIGVRLNGVKPDALLGVIGLKDGDVLKTINGFEMSDPTKALEAYARLRTANKLTIAVNRGGKDMNMDYNIK